MNTQIMLVISAAISFQSKACVGGSIPPLVSAPIAGYVIPNIIFWNVNSRHDVFHADHNRKGVQLASGQSVTVFKQILQNLGYNPVEAMENTINSERYDCITVE